ncbi:tRNA lysidine(34) synthetase TilS [Maribacter sp. ACAM166]|uniref:tRNA lysidine(34) synthetase TilS n=1 Tax=Maribacter sp. ACAM166 TaxID=2508996 RepID=UPI0010FD87E6|nr:tRNA lysidine(34) synthetase TilS [Maribacter sp. ACAM166]TLP79801.1 tRNA lysidine(34) synthetase TilS [Maribacter sp. ACAM166]
MLEAFKKHIENTFPELGTNHFLIACSGGLDSMVLTELCHEAGLHFSLAHCNFRLRGQESKGDEAFVREQAKELNKIIYVTHFDTMGYVNQHKVSVQMAARELRYVWFEHLLSQHKIPFLLTAHHANDNLETFLINLSRGTGIDGLTGIPAKTEVLRRPLLPFTRKQLEGYAQKQQLQWREDVSNTDTKYLRNKIRLEVIPLLNQLHPTFSDNFKNTLDYLGQTEAIASTYLKNLKEDLFVQKDEKLEISIEKLKELSPLSVYLHGLFKEYGFKELDNLEDLLDGLSGKQLVSNTHVLVKNREFLVLSPLKENNQNEQIFYVQKEVEQIDSPIALKFSVVQERYDNTSKVIYIQKDTLKYPLKIRKWKNGDYFYPIGLKGKKKLSKYFKDEKIDIVSKDEVWLLYSNEQIVWVVGMRADERFIVTDNSQEILKIEIT